MKDPYEFFPGDPPLGEGACYFGLLVAVIFGLLWLALRALTHVPAAQVMAKGAQRVMFVALMVVVAFACSIALRNVGDWGRLKAELRKRHAEVTACPVKCRWPQRHDSSPDAPRWEFRFTPDYEPVRLFVRGTDVLVDFGQGGAAEFDLDTMVVIYSD